eukprot:TRINITY_DN216_c0_g3_i3.p1 TRINITY_DN216_c0_g3~~TRINITY_DN216_c0_g3_i3.p1  ORF type:complete len:729 (+),score=164.75 TRINITY_DN216_c0_g3_i3:255-2189(+)
MSTPFRQGKYYYYFFNEGLQNQSVLFRQVGTQLESNETRTAFLDPNKLSADGTVALGSYAFSESGSHLAYALSRSGSDWSSIHIRDVETITDLPEVIDWVKFSGMAWTHNDRGFFYSRYPKPASHNEGDALDKKGSEVEANKHNALYYHRIGTPQQQDIKIIGDIEGHPTWLFGATVTDDGAYLLVSIRESTAPVNRLYYANLTNWKEAAEGQEGELKFVKLIDNFEAQYSYVTNKGSKFWFQTNLNAPKERVVTVDLAECVSGAPLQLRDVIPESSDPLQWVSCVGNFSVLAVAYMRDVKEVLQLHTIEGELKSVVELPSIGSIASVSGRPQDQELFYKFHSFLYAGSIFRVDLQTGAQTAFYHTPTRDFDPTLFSVTQDFYESTDKVKIPMFIIKKKTLLLDSSAPTLLYGYGGFSISLTPTYSATRIAFLTHYNAVLAVANIRGGAEYGEEWHTAAIKHKKQQGFDDFICAAEHLIKNRVTSPEKLAIMGGSNGGLLVTACANQKPHLFKAVVGQVGVLDMLRFHKFTIGHFWTADYGCSDNADDFATLIKYSPLHTIPSDHYPALLLTTGDHDDRVVPLHSFKFAATVQHKLGAVTRNPLLVRIEKKVGHGAGKPTSKVLDEIADIYAFLVRELGAVWHD